MARSANDKPIKPAFVTFPQWMKYSADERDIIAEMSEAEYKAMLAEASGNGEAKTAEPSVSAAIADTHVPPKDVADWAKSIAAKIDDKFRADMRQGVNLKKQVTHQTLVYVGHIDRLGLKLPRWDSVKPQGSNAPDTDYDVYMEPRESKKGKALDPVKRHRINDAFDASFPEYYLPLKTLKDMGADERKAMGENTHAEKLADASKEYLDARNYFSDAAEVYAIWKAINQVPGVRVQPHVKGDGSIEHKAFPWKLQDVILNDDGTVKDVRDGCNISTRDLQGYRPEVVNDMMQQKDEKGAPKWPSTYKALLNSQKPRKPRGASDKAKAKTADAKAQTSVASINDWESATSDMAPLTAAPGFRAEFIKRCNDPDQTVADDFLLDNGDIWKFYDQVFSMQVKGGGTLADRYGRLSDARTQREAAEQKKAS